MSLALSETSTQPVVAVLGRTRAELSSLADLALWSLGKPETAALVGEVSRAKAQLAELELRVARHAERLDLGTEVGAADTGAWWANTTCQTKAAAKRRLALAAGLDWAHERVRDAMATGVVSEEQAAVIVAGVDALPLSLVDPEVRARAEVELIGLARYHHARDLKRLADRILDVVAPEVAEEQEKRVLERQEEIAEQRCRFTISDDGHGQCHGRFTLPSQVGAMLKQAVFAFAAPKHRAATGRGLPVTGPLRLGQAFCEYVERYPVNRLPTSGGVDATVVVTMDLATLLGGEAPATLDTGDRISAGEARRLACEAGIVPMVLGGKSEILDLGRRARFHSKAQRTAIAHRDHTCTAEGCDWPAAMCHVHHDVPWSRGGRTTLDDGRLLCPRHHRYAHSPAYEMTKSKHGRVIFART